MLYHTAILALWLVLSAITFNVAQAAFEALAASSSSECCSTCIGKTSSVPYNYDPVVFSQCTAVSGGVCCFDCGEIGDPQYGDTVSYGSDGVTAVVKAGTYISFTWSSVVNVTFISLKTGQKKTKTPTFSDTAATEKSSTFLICAKTAGTIYFRGWGSDSCRAASQEYNVTVEAGDSTATTCDANDVKVPTASSSDSSGSSGDKTDSSIPADETVDTCNAQRASVQTVDGVQTCVCVSDWTHPPECDQWPTWKWLVTIGGAVATLCSIIMSARAFLQSRKKKQEEADRLDTLAQKKHEEDYPKNQEDEYRENLAPMGTKSDIDPADLTPASGFQKHEPDVQRTPGGTRKPDERLFSL
ncbi:unnamed protein product [Phytophthora fragariaefolia]|uniref:Unnamed protein product n=1 Tax=Phytophthora fragariaefolia TaxID=1490495 RepID=A0A9W7CNJ9_9STRA|nr:unnamed protein product [Phytophthora fragariaefolia]